MNRDELHVPPSPVKCANPFCKVIVRVRGEFCRTCRAEQQRTREQLAARRAQRTA